MSFVIIILFLIVAIAIINEKVLHLQSDIALLLCSLVISLCVSGISYIPLFSGIQPYIRSIGDFGFETYLLDFVLCFMLFAGASKVNMVKFKQNVKAISLLALLTTLISSALYGLLFFLAASVLGMPVDIWTCILLGCIVSPTDPIAATGILNKMGLSKSVTSIIENESLFNDGTGVALFVFVKSIVANSGKSNFFAVILQEVCGAVAVAFLVSFLLFSLLKLSKKPVIHLLISLLDVSLVYFICEHFGFSGVIASVVCGMFFSYNMDKIRNRRLVCDPHNIYSVFWDAADSILNSVLFVMIGVSVLNFTPSPWFIALAVVGIIAVVVSRFFGVALSAVLVGKKRIPSSYSLFEFVSLMTWSALKGGLSLALAMSTRQVLSSEVYSIILSSVYITIFFTVIVQGLTLKPGYKLIEGHKARRIKKESEGNPV